MYEQIKKFYYNLTFVIYNIVDNPLRFDNLAVWKTCMDKFCPLEHLGVKVDWANLIHRVVFFIVSSTMPCILVAPFKVHK